MDGYSRWFPGSYLMHDGEQKRDVMVSVIIPSYNSEKYIGATLESVCAQTYRDLEILVMNDCSRDQTAEIVEGFATRDPRVQLINLEGNRGVSHARNEGVRLARGEWIAFLDSDDLWMEDKIEKQLQMWEHVEEVRRTREAGTSVRCTGTSAADIGLADDTPEGFLFTGSAFIDENGSPLPSILHVPSRVGFRELLKQNVISCSSVLIRKSLIARYPMPCSDRFHEDFATWLTILKNEHIEAQGLDEPLLRYRVTASSRSGNKLHAAMMTFRAYRFIGLSPAAAFRYWMSYVHRSLRKYRGMRGGRS